MDVEEVHFVCRQTVGGWGGLRTSTKALGGGGGWHDAGLCCSPQPAVPIGLSPLTLALSLNPLPPQAACPRPSASHPLVPPPPPPSPSAWPTLTSHTPTPPSFPSGGGANAPPRLALFHCSASGPRGGGGGLTNAQARSSGHPQTGGGGTLPNGGCWAPGGSPNRPPPPLRSPAPRHRDDTPKTRSEDRRVGMCKGERPMGAAKGTQTNTMASCPPPPPTTRSIVCGRRWASGCQLAQPVLLTTPPIPTHHRPTTAPSPPPLPTLIADV